MKPLHTSFARSTLAASFMALSVAGCTTVEQSNCYDDSFCVEPTDGMILPTTVTSTDCAVRFDFGEVITARPVITVTGPAKAEIRYRTCGDAAGAVESAFKLPDLDYHEKASDIMDRLVMITATHESKEVRKFRFLDIELSKGVDILRTGGMPPSSQASSPRRTARPW